jgi:hypothetical protein
MGAALLQLTVELVSCIYQWGQPEDCGRLVCACRCASTVVNVAEARTWLEKCKLWAQAGQLRTPMPPLPLLMLSYMRECLWLSLHYLNYSGASGALGARGDLHEYLSKVRVAISRLEAALARVRTGTVSSSHVRLVSVVICTSLLAPN